MRVHKAFCITVIGMLLLSLNVLAVVYDDEGKVITEDQIKQEMGHASGRIFCGCLGETLGFSLGLWGNSGADDATQHRKAILLTGCTIIPAGAGYWIGEILDNHQDNNVNYGKGRTIGAYLGGLSLFAVGIVSAAKVGGDTATLALLALTPIEAVGGSVIGYKIGKLFDRRIAIRQIKERRRQERAF